MNHYEEKRTVGGKRPSCPLILRFLLNLKNSLLRPGFEINSHQPIRTNRQPSYPPSPASVRKGAAIPQRGYF
jgi:hypothetical protein